MSQTPENFGELGPCDTFADVIRRQGLRFEAEGKKARAALRGMGSEQNVRRYSERTAGGVGGQMPQGQSIHDGFPHWPMPMQVDYLIVLTRGSGLDIQVGLAATGEGGVRGDLMVDAMRHQDEAHKLTQLVYQAKLDGHIDSGEASNIVAATEVGISTLRQVASKALFASTSRPLSGRGGR